MLLLLCLLFLAGCATRSGHSNRQEEQLAMVLNEINALSIEALIFETNYSTIYRIRTKRDTGDDVKTLTKSGNKTYRDDNMLQEAIKARNSLNIICSCLKKRIILLNQDLLIDRFPSMVKPESGESREKIRQ